MKQSQLSMLPVSTGLPGYCSQGSLAPSLGAFQITHFYICVIVRVIPSPHLTLQSAHTILAPHMMIK